MLRVVGTDNPGTEGFSIGVDGQRIVHFCLNDYLGLRRHPAVIAGARRALEEQGAGSGASMVAGGHRPVHHELEQRLAAFKDVDACRVTSSGYTAALAAVQALVNLPDRSSRPVLFDRLTHACLLDGIRLYAPKDRCRSFRHNDVGHLEELLIRVGRVGPAPLVVVEGLYSMDGDNAPLGAIVEVCERHGAWLLVDDAHGTGTRGPGGRGSLSEAGLAARGRRIVVMGTLSKALGSQGGFVAGPRAVLDWMVTASRAYLFDTGLSPACAGAALAALEVLDAEPDRVAALHEMSREFQQGLFGMESELAGTGQLKGLWDGVAGPIFPLVTGTVDRTMDLHGHLLGCGYRTGAVRPPTVRPGTSRIRVTLNLTHRHEDLMGLLECVRGWLERVGE